MASIRKKAGKWRAEVRRKGAYRSASFDSKLEAQAWAVEVEQGLGAYGSRVAVTRTLGEAMQRYADEVAHRHKGERWFFLFFPPAALFEHRIRHAESVSPS